MAKAEEQRKK
jgi:hypothetical protein